WSNAVTSSPAPRRGTASWQRWTIRQSPTRHSSNCYEAGGGTSKDVVADFEPIEPLAPEHDLDGFDCGTHALNHWLTTWPRHSQKEGSARPFLACQDGGRRVVGFHSLAAASASREETPRKIGRPLAPRLPVPVVLLARLAVDRRHQGRGLGAALV